MSALRFGVYCEMQSPPDKSHPELTWEVFRLIEHADALGYDVYSLLATTPTIRGKREGRTVACRTGEETQDIFAG